MNTIKLNKAVLKAALLIAPNKDAREYLNGVCIKPTTDKTYSVVSTCGTVLFLCEECFGSLDETVIIPVETVKAAIKLLPNSDKTIDLVITENTMQLGGIVFKSKEGTFPDYTKIIPMYHSDEAGQFNYELLYKAQNAMRLATENPKGLFKVQHNGSSAAKMISVSNPGIVTVVQPLRSDNEKIWS